METILKATVNVMVSINSLFRGYAMQFAMEDNGELDDLKGLVNPLGFTGVEFDLLDILEHPLIKLMMRSIIAAHDTLESIVLINGFDEEEVMTNYEGKLLAEDVYETFAYPLFDFENYDSAIIDISLLYQTSTFCLYAMAFLLSNGGIDLDSPHFENLCETQPENSDLELLDIDNKNVSLLYNLILIRKNERQYVFDFFK